MGGGGTLVDGIRRFFHRRTSPNSAINHSHLHHHHQYQYHEHQNNNNDNNNNNVNINSNNLVFVNDLQAQSPDHQTDQHCDISALKLLKVPTRSHFKDKPFSMDPQKKVHFSPIVIVPSNSDYCYALILLIVPNNG